jgi:hypothetical protein
MWFFARMQSKMDFQPSSLTETSCATLEGTGVFFDPEMNGFFVASEVRFQCEDFLA